ncbi:MAG: cellulase family glycosylhydrolase [Magnetococcales bacterium]|nr:cellulase family glycosylhydrolase [Magnetococcales bacterium]
MNRWIQHATAHALTKAILTLLAIVVICIPRPASAETSTLSPFGMGIYLYRYLNDPPKMAHIAAMAEKAGIRWTRDEFNWGVIEPVKGQYDFSQYDAMMAIHKKHNIEVMGLLAYGNDHYFGQTPSEPEHYEAFAQFATDVVRRYKDQVHYWEIWNEPNAPAFWQPQPDADAYTELLKVTAQAIREVDPEAKIICCVTGGIDISYINRVMEQGGGEYADYIGVHPYSPPIPFETAMKEPIEDLKSMLHRHGQDDKPIWASELGFPTDTGFEGVTDERQGELLVRTYLSAIRHGFVQTNWYDFVNDSDNPTENGGMAGILNYDLTPKPAWFAFQNMTRLLGESRFERVIKLDESSEGLLFKTDDQKSILAYWTTDENEDSSGTLVVEVRELSVTITGQVEGILTHMGHPQPLTFEEVASGPRQIKLSVDGAPRFLIGRFQLPDYGYDENRALGIAFDDIKLAHCIRDSGAQATSEIIDLDCAARGIETLGGIEHLESLENINLAANPIDDITPLAAVTTLKMAKLIGTDIDDLTPLQDNTLLEWLQLSWTLAEDVEPLTELAHLTDLDLTGLGMTHVDSLAGFNHLIALNISINPLTDLNGLSELTTLEWLLISEHELTDISPVANLTRLNFLELPLGNIVDISPVTQLDQLEWLSFWGNPVADISPLQGMDQLLSLELANTGLSDVTPLSGLTSLEILRLNMNNIQDVSALKTLSALRILSLENNPVNSGVRELASLTNLEYLDLNEDYDILCADLDYLEETLGEEVVSRPWECRSEEG